MIPIISLLLLSHLFLQKFRQTEPKIHMEVQENQNNQSNLEKEVWGGRTHTFLVQN